MPVAAAGPLKLTAGSADPDAGTAGDAFTFAATYVSKDDAPPAFVRVVVDGTAHGMTPNNASDSDMRDGARYQVRIKIKAAGTHSYSFVAQDSKGRQTSLAGRTIKVAPKPKPKPKPQPTSKPAPKPATASGSTRPRSTPRPTRAPTASVAPDHAAAVAAAFLGYDGGPGSDGSGGVGAGAFGPLGVLSPAPTDPQPAVDPVPGGVDSTAGGASGGPRIGSIAALTASLPGLGSDRWLTIAARSAVVATGTAAVVTMALFTFKRRRREDEDPYDLPTPDDALDDTAPPAPDARPVEAPLTGEMAMPRWRRPSLNEARKAAPGTSLAAIEAERLTFARGAVAGDPGNERRRIRYRMVRLADSPDEILGQEIGRLDEGDEVELLERSGLYWKVRTPRGEIGWVHKMTLGDVVTAGPAIDDDDDDSDVLAAFNEAQAMRAVQASEPVLGEGLAARFIRERGVN
jgi:hypothetical protein